MSNFQKRHYEQIARVIAEQLDHEGFDHESDKLIFKNVLVEDLSRLFARDNPLFNAEKFRRACGET